MMVLQDAPRFASPGTPGESSHRWGVTPAWSVSVWQWMEHCLSQIMLLWIRDLGQSDSMRTTDSYSHLTRGQDILTFIQSTLIRVSWASWTDIP
ncbi:uncharacterized protein METZ01_LOCUS115419 [marine metagenome]|uniref:Uncharacterized protein n=1 Tax=marine metagenome TaxID=408172 RepID=A0A381XCU2_9ZZZZ